MTALRPLVGPIAAGFCALALLAGAPGCSSGEDAAPGDAGTSTTTVPSTQTALAPVTTATATTATTPTAPPSTVPSPPPTGGGLDGRVIVVDPGHNGANGAHPTEINRLVDGGGFQKACNTTGAAEGDLTESRFNWETAQLVRDELEAAGATVVLTRSSDDGWGPCVDQRALTAQREDADLLISIHADGADPAASGFHVIHPASGPAVSPADRDGSAALAAAVRDALVAEGLRPADYVGGGSGLVERDDIVTVNRAGVPAVMLESGNLHNPSDLAVLRSEAGRRRIADALTAATIAYLA